MNICITGCVHRVKKVEHQQGNEREDFIGL